MAAHKKGSPGSVRKRRISARKLFTWCLFSALLAIIVALSGYLFVIFQGKKLLQENIAENKLTMDQASIIYDADNREVTRLGVNRELVDFKDIPQELQDAFIATEDKRFEKHNGVDFMGVARALVTDVISGGAVEGGSTITQQLAKNMFLYSDKTLFRKGTEMSIALALERQFSKDKILEMYLNRIYFGKSAYGVKAAAKRYFGVNDLAKLELWQMATLAGIPKSPAAYNPIDHPDNSKDRRAVVLKLMADQGYITEDERAKAAAVDYKPPGVQGDKNDFQTYADYVTREADDEYGIAEEKLINDGYRIYTTMRTNAQQIMADAYDNDKLFQATKKDDIQIQSAMVIINNKDGGIVAMIGGRDYAAKGLNRVLVPRQPGSSIKPLVVYGPAIQTGKYNPYSMLTDEEQSFNGYTPRNYNGVYQGKVSMFEAVQKSINQPAVWLLNQIGLKTGMQFAQNLGLTFDPKDNNLAIALGGLTVGETPLQMAQAYSAFANNGYLNKAHAIVKIVDSHGTEIPRRKQEKGSQVMNPKTAFYMTKVMQGVVVAPGTGTAANLGDRPVAGKTGSTQLSTGNKTLDAKYNGDIWFCGYTPEWTAAVWEGFDRTDTKHYVAVGSGGTAAIFREVMSKALAKAPIVPFAKPDGVPDLSASPQAVSDLAATYKAEEHKVTLTWTPVDDIATYEVYRKGSKDHDFVKLLEVKTPEVNDITVLPGDTYQYYVIALNPDTNLTGEQSNVITIQTGAASASPSPTPGISPVPSGSGKPGDLKSSATPKSGLPQPSISGGATPGQTGTAGDGKSGKNAATATPGAGSDQSLAQPAGSSPQSTTAAAQTSG